MIYITNLNNQLNLTYDTRKDVYAFDSIKSVGFSWDTNGDYYVTINFIANDKNNSLRIYLKDVDPTLGWVNTFAGSTLAVNTIASWMNKVIEVNLDATNDQVGVYGYVSGAAGSPVPLNVNATGQVAIQDGGNSITVDGGTGVSRTPTILRTSTNSSVAAGAYSVSFASVGTVDSTVGGATLKPGETINFDAGAINNTLGAITYNSSTAGAELLIITLT
jgi:hypothetical protein